MLAFLFKTPIGIIISLVSGLIGIALILFVVTAGLAFTGGPDPCTPGGGDIEVSDAQASSFDQKWDQLDSELDGGSRSSITLTEGEVTSRANKYIDDEGADVDNLRVCIHDGFGEVTGEVDAFVGSSKFKTTGTVTLTDDRLAVDFQDIEVGNVPDAVIGPFENAVENGIQELLDDIALKHTYVPTLTEGQAEIEGTP
jgi:hypothetical protein